MTRTHIFLPDGALERLKALSSETGLSVSELVRRAIDDYLKSLEKQSKRRAVT